MRKHVSEQMHRRVEQLKTVVLVVLFFSTILLLYFFWENQFFGAFQFPEIGNTQKEYSAMPLSEIVVPDNIYASSGNGVYVKVTSGKKELWEQGIREIRKFGEASNILVNEISKQQFTEAMSDYTSLQFDLGYEIPFSQFFDYYGIRRNQSLDALESLSAIAYSTASSESIFIVQEQRGKYYRLVADEDYTNFRSIAETACQSGVAAYYPFSTLIGVENTTIVPWEASVTYRPLTWKSERQLGTEDDIRLLAQSFFGENFDFIRRMMDSKGNITYMYGYGQKTFITYTNGVFEYKEEVEESSSGQPKFYSSLDTALQFVTAHGAWSTFDDRPVKVFLSRAKSIEKNKRKGYRFEFGLTVDDIPIYYDQGTSIVIEVLNGQVSYYKRNLIQFEYEDDEEQGVQTNLANIIASNYDDIYRLMKPEKPEKSEKNEVAVASDLAEGNTLGPADAQQVDQFDWVAARISDARLGYFCKISANAADPSATELENQEEQQLIPAWIVTVEDKLQIYFDVTSGEMLGNQTLNRAEKP